MATTEHEPRPSEPPRFGPALRAAREAAGRTLDDVARTTRIRRAYLEALEAEDWGRVPRGVIGRGFVRVVAKEIGAAEAELLD
ncbi:MAG: helix-turn-helix domain-containing protein, partial [Deltaproteobacteria bacterium]|nr:helix-turn-helix domain-containing protein [Deltaproteobacteria bacterium]